MALLFFDGFDHVGTANPGPSGVAKYAANLVGAGLTCVTTPVRTGTGALRLTNSNLTTKILPASGGGVLGLAINIGSYSTGNDIAILYEGATAHVAVGFTSLGLLNIRRGSTTLATGTTTLALNTWYYLQLSAVIHDTAGSYLLQIDGVTELSASGIDTRNGGTTGQWDRVMLQGTGGALHIDDFYVCDTSGSAPYNTFLGPVKVDTIYSQTDAVAAGSNAGLTPSTGTDHGALVDEAAPNTTDYNSSATVGAKDTYNYPSMALTGVILAIQTNLYCQKSDASARSVCAVVRSGGTDYDGANASPLTTWSYLTEVRTVNPATAAPWTAAEIAALEAGMKVTV